MIDQGQYEHVMDLTRSLNDPSYWTKENIEEWMKKVSSLFSRLTMDDPIIKLYLSMVSTSMLCAAGIELVYREEGGKRILGLVGAPLNAKFEVVETPKVPPLPAPEEGPSLSMQEQELDESGETHWLLKTGDLFDIDYRWHDEGRIDTLRAMQDFDLSGAFSEFTRQHLEKSQGSYSPAEDYGSTFVDYLLTKGVAKEICRPNFGLPDIGGGGPRPMDEMVLEATVALKGGCSSDQ